MEAIKNKKILVVGIIILIAIGVIVGYYLYKKGKSQPISNEELVSKSEKQIFITKDRENELIKQMSALSGSNISAKESAKIKNSIISDSEKSNLTIEESKIIIESMTAK